ncbi:hypothetical protein JCM10212_000139 [Sporobolomyces blumeae]
MSRLLRSTRPFLRSCYPRSSPAPTLRRSFFWSASVDLAATSIPQVSQDLLPFLFGVVLANAATGLDEEDEANGGVKKLHSPPWNVVEMPGKGYGAVASSDLSLGQLLIAERPLCIWPSSLSAAAAQELFDQLTPREQAAYMALAPCVADDHGLDEIRSRRAANGFEIKLPSVPGYSGTQMVAMLFPKISRINHSCTPNASQVMNFMTLRMEVYSTSPVPASTEITIEYIPGLITMSKAERQAALYEAFGFSSCLCPVCTGSPEEVKKSDERRREIKVLSETLEGRGDRKATLDKMERIRVLLQDEGYKGLPAFSDQGVSSAFAVYSSLKAHLGTHPDTLDLAWTDSVSPLSDLDARSPLAVPSTDLAALSMPLPSRLDGLNHLFPDPTSFVTTAATSTLPPLLLDELVSAQHSLDMWTSTVFHQDSPASTPFALHSPAIVGGTSSASVPASTDSYDWSTLYPQLGYPVSSSTAEPTNPVVPHPLYASAAATTVSPASTLPTLPASDAFPPRRPSLPAYSSSISLPETNSTASRAPTPASVPASPHPTRPSRPRRNARSRQGAESLPDEESASTPREAMTPEAYEEDKRRRNTEASARFRAKKKQRNEALQNSTAELRDKVARLEKERDALATQNKWLRDIVSEKAEINPALSAFLAP